MKLLFRKARQTGDTIVEVILAIAVISMVLVGAYAVTQHSTTAVRNGQEHSEMLQILQGQVEHVRAKALDQTTASGGIFAAGKFCIDTKDITYPRIDATDPTFATKCKKIQSLYDITVEYDTSGTNIFTFTGTWQQLDGVQGKEVLKYRVYANEPVGTLPAGVVVAGGGGGGGGGDGEAIIDTYGACGGLGQPSCDIVARTKYVWTYTVTNYSNNPSDKILGCTIDWGDGTSKSFVGDVYPCRINDAIKHDYPHLFADSTFPAGCYAQTQYTVVLTMKILDKGDVVSKPRYAKLPYCGP